MIAGKTCALPGCSKLLPPSSDSATPHLACGNLHHQLLMAGRFNPSPPHPHQHILDRNAAELCALPSCLNPPRPGDSWCSCSHYLLWLSDFTSSLHPDQVCKLPDCTRHVFVDDNRSHSQFCGWRHCQKYVMLSARQQLPQQPSPPRSSVAETLQNEHGHLPSVDLLVHSLGDYALSTNAPKNIKVDYDFFDKHPWEVCAGVLAEGNACLLIVRCKYTSKGNRVMVTKDYCHWKQQGPPYRRDNHTVKYFTYRIRRGKKHNEAVELSNGRTYNMEEYTIEGVKDFSLVKVRKSRDGDGKHRKGRRAAAGKQSCNACSQNTSLTSKRSETFDESFFLNLLQDCPSDFDENLGVPLCTEGY